MTASELREHVIGWAVEELDELDGARIALEEGAVDSAGSHLGRARSVVLRLDLSVPVAFAAQLLDVGEPTVRDWIDAGVLRVAERRPLGLTFRSVVEARRDLHELRREGASANLRRALLHRIQDRQTLEDTRLRRSIEQMRTGPRHYVHRRSGS